MVTDCIGLKVNNKLNRYVPWIFFKNCMVQCCTERQPIYKTLTNISTAFGGFYFVLSDVNILLNIQKEMSSYVYKHIQIPLK